MKIGLISDSHDHLDNIRKAVDIFNKEDIDFLVHCGDFVAPFVVRPFEGLNDKIKNGNFIGVHGNNDGEILGLKNILGKICDIKGHEAIVEIDGKKIYVSHMPIPTVIKSLAISNQFDIIASGHTHQAKIEKIGSTLVVNPGEACGWLFGKATIMIVDLDSMDARLIDL